MNETALEHAFSISPETVFGILVGFMAIAIIALWMKNSTLQKELLKLVYENTNAIKDISATLAVIRESMTRENKHDLQTLQNELQKLNSKFDRIGNGK